MSSRISFTLIVFLTSLWVCDSAKILIISPSSMYSHHMALREVWKELHNRGHNITFTTAFKEDENIANFTKIDTSKTKHLMTTKYTAARISSLSRWFMWNTYWDLTFDSQSIILSLPEIQDIIQNPGKYQFDAVIAELWHSNMLAISKIYKCPSIAYATIDMFEALHWHLGNQMNHVTLPDLNSGLFVATNFVERLTSAVYTLHELYKEYFVYIPQQNLILDRFFRKYVDVNSEELKQNIDLMLVNANPFLMGLRALSPTTVLIGGGNHLNPPEELPQDIKSFLDDAKDGFIYMSLGSNVKSKDLDDSVLMALTEVMSKLPYKILWKFEADQLPMKPKNVKIVKWAPQQDILRHPNIKLFISQGGIHSMEETIFSHVPMLVMPFLGDQYKNGQMATVKGFGKMIQHKRHLDKFELENVIHELIDNPKYKNTAIRLAKLMNDSYMTGLEKSVWWIEYVIRNNGTKELRNPAATLPFYQYYALDVIGFLLTVSIAMVTSVTVVLSRICRLLLVIRNKKTSKKHKKH